MKTMIKITTLMMILTFAMNIDSFAETTLPGSRPTFKVLGKKKKLSLESSYYSLRFNTHHVNKCPKLGKKRKFLAFL